MVDAEGSRRQHHEMSEGPPSKKVKTVAKQRYLKSKVKRRKARKALTKRTPTDNNTEEYSQESVPPDLGHSLVDAQSVSAANQAESEDAGYDNGSEPDSDATPSSSSSSRTKQEDTAAANQFSSSSSSSTPPPIEPFPIPTKAAEPDPRILAGQGLPAGLSSAIIVDESLRRSLDDWDDGDIQLSSHMMRNLRRLGIAELFGVQAEVFPLILKEAVVPPPRYVPPDYLISAPTGSGKTIAYALPLIEVLSKRQVIRLRALIVLPTRELVQQVKETVENLAEGTDLKIATISGQQSFKHEQEKIVQNLETKLLGGSSKVDIIIATPGRLTDHIKSTPNFSLQHLRFLVIDEADRLLHQSFQDWLPTINTDIFPPLYPQNVPPIEALPWDHVAPAWRESRGLPALTSSEFRQRIIVPCQKLLFSATLTHDPSKVAALSLRDPHYVIVRSSTKARGKSNFGEEFNIPTQLSEYMIIDRSDLKPLIFIHLLFARGIKNALVFTKSIESTLRLQNLLDTFQQYHKGPDVRIGTYSAEMKVGTRKSIMKDFETGMIHVLICSDLIARGVDLPAVEHVISYDVPLDMRKYVHRVGRTARAGKAGTAWTLVEKQEAAYFKTVLKDAGHTDRVKRIRLKDEDLEPFKPSYENALKVFATTV